MTWAERGRKPGRTACRAALAAALAGALAACTTTRLEYDMPMTRVVAQPGGESAAPETVDEGHVFHDELVRIGTRAADGRFHLDIRNRGDRTARLQWEEASYVDPAGRASPVVDLEAASGPTVIPAGAEVHVTAVPEAHVRERDIGDFFDIRQVEGLEGSTVRLLLPFVIGEQRREYTLSFTVTRAEVITERRYPSGHETFLISNPEKADE